MQKHGEDEDQLIKNAKLFIAVRENKDSEDKIANILKCFHNGTEINTQFENDNNNTALHISVIKGDVEIVKFLLDHGADVMLKNNDGKSPLEVARGLNTNEAHELSQILHSHGKVWQSNAKGPEAKEEEIEDVEKPKQRYKKRSGTSGVNGQLYETKLLTLVLFRALTNKKIEEFLLATNIDEIGALDDLCIRYKQEDKDVVIFLQAKHKNDVKKGQITVQDLWRTNGDFGLGKYFDSYLKIRQKFNDKNKNCIFQGNFTDVKCSFVLHTTVNHDLNDRKRVDKKSMDKTAIDLISTGNNVDIFQYEYDERDVHVLTMTILVQRMKQMGTKLIEFIQEDKYKMMMSDENIRNFHLVLAQKVINVSELNSDGYRTGTFRKEFFSSNEELLITLRDTLYTEAINKTKLQTKEIDEFIANMLYSKSTKAISKLIGHVVYYDTRNSRLTVDENKTKDTIFGKCLSDIQIRQAVAREAYNIAGKEKLLSYQPFRLPAAFGNSDLTINENKAGKRLNYLSEKIRDVINMASNNCITINESIVGPNKLLESGVMDVNGGLGGAIGNLLIIDEASGLLKFNMNDEVLGPNAKILLERLKKMTTDLAKYRLIININGFPRITLVPDEYEKSFAKDFLNNLWFYTRQAREDKIEKIVKCEIDKHYIANHQHQHVIRVYSDAIFLKIHDEVQKWWMIEDQAEYLTNNKHFLKKILNDIVDSPLLNVLNFLYIKQAKTKEIEFNEDVIQSLNLYGIAAELIIIETDINILTGVKLVQHFNGLNNHKFIDLDYVLRLPNSIFESLINEIIMVSNDTLIIFYDNKSNSKDLHKLSRLIQQSNDETRLIIVTNKHLAKVIEENISNNKCIKVTDEKTKLTDLASTSQQTILETDFKFQGVDVRLDAVIDSESKHLINAEVLLKIFNAEDIVIGKTLVNSHYDKIKENYIHRNLGKGKKCTFYWPFEETGYSSSTSSDEEPNFLPFHVKRTKEIFEIKCLKDLTGTVVVLAAPGMGKSTLLSHLSIETKKKYHNIWIERVNLLDHTRQFRKWQEDKTQVDVKEALKFICNAAIVKNVFEYNNKRDNNDEILFELDIVDDKFVLKSAKMNNDVDLFELQLFINLYNKGQVVLLFDGFDEICPHYKREITEMLKCISMRAVGTSLEREDEPASGSNEGSESKQRLWITSRSYNNIKKTLECQFGKSYTLEPLSRTEQDIYLENYLKIHLNLSALNFEQFKNIDGLIEYMRQFNKSYYEDESVKLVKSTGVPLHRVYATAVEYFQSEIKRIPLTEDKLEFKAKWNLDTQLFKLFDKFLGDSYELSDAINLAGIPLHIYLASDYFQHVIKETNCSQDDTNNIKKWDLDSNTFAFYKRFLDTKMKKIRFEEKNKMDTSNPDIQIAYEKELKDFTEKHKRLAFYAIFSDHLGDMLSDEEVKDIKETIKRMESAEEKTGLVDCIVNGVPRFVHLVFAEYFAVEFIADKLKSAKEIESQKVVWYFILYKVMFRSSHGVLDVFDHKVRSDREISDAASDAVIREYIFEELKEQTVNPYPPEAFDDFDDNNWASMAYETALNKSVNNGLRHVASLLLRAIVDVVNEDNVDTFIDLVTSRERMITSMVALRHDDLLELIMDTIKRVDARKIFNLYHFCNPGVDIINCSNVDIINDLRVQTKEVIGRSYGNSHDYSIDDRSFLYLRR